MPSAATIGGSDTLTYERGYPKITLGEQVRVECLYSGSYANAWSNRAYKGDTFVFTVPGTSTSLTLEVEACNVNYTTGTRGLLSIVAVGFVSDQTLPADVEAVTPQRTDLKIEEHPTWASKLTPEVVKDMEDAVRSGKTYSQIIADARWAYIDTDADFSEILELRLKGVHVYAVWPPVVKVTSHYLVCPTLTDGGFQETPVLNTMTVPNVAYLRAADDVEWNGSFFRVTRTWMGAPEWNESLYPPL